MSVFDAAAYSIVGASVALGGYAMTPEGTHALFGWVQPVETLLGVEKARAPSQGICFTVVLCLAAVALTMLHLIGHLNNYRKPNEQRYIVRIMLMVPIYAIDSLVGFVWHKRSEELAVLRDTYEAYVLYNFFHLLMSFVGGEVGTVAMWNKHNVDGDKATMAHAFPMNYVWAPFKLNLTTVKTWRVMLVQYMVLSPLFTLATYIGLYEGDTTEETIGWFVTICRNLSVTCAFTALMYFYLCSKKLAPMKPHHPTGKFIAVKLVIALSFWQYLGLSAIAGHNMFPTGTRRFLFTWAPHRQTPEAAEQALENLLTVAEMLVTAVLHHQVYSHTEYTVANLKAVAVAKGNDPKEVDALPKYSFGAAVLHAFSVGDVFAETKQNAQQQLYRAKMKIGGVGTTPTPPAGAAAATVNDSGQQKVASPSPNSKRRAKKED